MTTIFHRAQIDREKLQEIILKNPADLQDGLSFIDHQLGTREEGVIDFLGVDKTGRLAVVDFDIRENDRLLVEALSELQWLRKNTRLIKRLFYNENVDFNKAPQLLLIGPSFSEKSKSAARQLMTFDVKLIQYKYMVSKTEDALFFEEIFFDETYQPPLPKSTDGKPKTELSFEYKPTALKSTEQKIAVSTSKSEQVSLTDEEIAEFMDFDKALETAPD